MKLSRFGFAAVLLIACAPLALGQGTYTQIDVPGAAGTFCYGIDTAGDLVGYYGDMSGILHGFVLSNGNYTTIDYPGGNGTLLTGINDNGQVVGTNGATPPTGFMYNLVTQTFVTIAYPHAYETFPYSINDSGTIVGFYQRIQDNYTKSGFAVSNMKYKTVNPPGTQGSYITGITSTNELAGYISTSSGDKSFLLLNGKYRNADIAGAPNAVVYGINTSGSALVGYYQPTFGKSVGFLYQNGVTQTLEFPSALDTAATSVDSGGEVVGFFYDQSFTPHGFAWTPPAAEAKK